MQGETFFGTSWTVLAGFLFTLGHFAGLMAVATHFYGVHTGYRSLRSGIARWSRWLTLENALMAGTLMILCSLVGLAFVGAQWSSGGYLALTSILPMTLALVLGTVGVQTALGGFLVSIIAGHDARPFQRTDK